MLTSNQVISATLLTILFAIVGCDLNNQTVREGFSTTSSAETSPESALHGEEKAEKLRRDILFQLGRQQRTVEAILQASTWQEAHRTGQRILSNSDLSNAQRLKLAEQMLEEHLLGTDSKHTSDNYTKALSQYTELLVANGSTEILTISSALSQLQGHWSTKRIRQAARETLQRSQEQRVERPRKDMYAKLGIMEKLSPAQRSQVRAALKQKAEAIQRLESMQ